MLRQERIFKRTASFAGKVLSTHMRLNNKHYSFGVSEKAIGGLCCNTRAVMTDDQDSSAFAIFSVQSDVVRRSK